MFYFYNTLTREHELFTPGPIIRMYTCGPTVYDHAHIGNFRAYVFEDLLQRHLEAQGNRVERVMNLTDVDDKTIRGARREGISLDKFTARYKEAFFQDSAALRLRPACATPAATDPENIAAMIAMIQVLLDQGNAYIAEDHSVYFRITSFSRYGALAQVDRDAQRSTLRMKHDEYSKEEIADFALWKAWDEEDGDVAWQSPWGKGRPGWHIECSAMATRLLGPHIDIHCGGVDNIFPHHEAEIAQCECVNGTQFVSLWMHCAHLMVNGMKMSKSAGNFYTVRDLMEQGWSGREIRYALLSVHYRMPLNFTLEGIASARQALHRIDEWRTRLEEYLANVPSQTTSLTRIFHADRDEEAAKPDGVRQTNILTPDCMCTYSPSHNVSLTQYPSGFPVSAVDRCEISGLSLETFGAVNVRDFFIALNDDLNISAALGVLFEVIRESHRLLDQKALLPTDVRALLDWWYKVDSVLAIASDSLDGDIPEEVQQLVALRQAARFLKNWEESDRLRDTIAGLGWSIKDSKSEQKLVRQA